MDPFRTADRLMTPARGQQASHDLGAQIGDPIWSLAVPYHPRRVPRVELARGIELKTPSEFRYHATACRQLDPLHRGLLVIVRPEGGFPTKSTRLPLRWVSTGRLLVDGDVDPAVDR